MSCNCFGYQDLRPRQLQLLLGPEKVYDVDGTSVGPVHRASVGTVGTSDRCPADTLDPRLRGTAPELERRRARSRSVEVDAPRGDSSGLTVLAQGR